MTIDQAIRLASRRYPMPWREAGGWVYETGGRVFTVRDQCLAERRAAVARNATTLIRGGEAGLRAAQLVASGADVKSAVTSAIARRRA